MTLLGVICHSTHVEKAQECKQSIKQQLCFFFVVVFLDSLHSFFFFSTPSKAKVFYPQEFSRFYFVCQVSYDKHRGQVSEVYLNPMLLDHTCLYPSLILSLSFHHHHLSALLCVLCKQTGSRKMESDKVSYRYGTSKMETVTFYLAHLCSLSVITKMKRRTGYPLILQ